MELFKKMLSIVIIVLLIGGSIVTGENNEKVTKLESADNFLKLSNVHFHNTSTFRENLGKSLGYDVMFSQSFNMFGDITIFFSDKNKGKTVYEDFWSIDDEITKLSWWGLPLHGATSNPSFDGSAEDMSFDIVFYDDHEGMLSSPPDDVIKSFDAEASQIIIQSYIHITLNDVTYHFTEFSFELPTPIEVSDGDGWVSIESVNDATDDYFGWLNSEDGDNFIYQNGGKSNDVAFKLFKEAWVNHPPSTPSRPSGETAGKASQEYQYSTIATDPDDDYIEYEWDFDGDKIADEWTGFYESGDTCKVSWTWSDKGDYQVRVKAIDENNDESDWSQPLSVTMPKTKIFSNPLLVSLENFVLNNRDLFPILGYIFCLELR